MPIVAVAVLTLSAWLASRSPNTDNRLPVSSLKVSTKKPPPSISIWLLLRIMKESLPTANTTSLSLRVLTTSPAPILVAKSAFEPFTLTSPSRLNIDLLSGSLSGVLPHQAECTSPNGVIVSAPAVSIRTKY